ncbi:MAG: hypothetical protein ABSG71_04035 [Thermodesulfobacteriota bacterium]
MRKSLFGKVMTLTTVFLIMASALTFAQEEGVFRIEALITIVDLQKNIMIVDEKTFDLDQNTKFNNEKGSPITVDRLRAKTWVYIEGVMDSTKKRVMAEKIYTLPKYIDKKEKHLHQFSNETKSFDDSSILNKEITLMDYQVFIQARCKWLRS